MVALKFDLMSHSQVYIKTKTKTEQKNINNNKQKYEPTNNKIHLIKLAQLKASYTT